MGKVLVIVIGFAIVSFVLTDLLGPNSTLLGGVNNDIGEIAGTTISYEEFQSLVEERSANYSLNFGRNPSDRELIGIRQEAWELLIVKHAFQDQYDALGLDVHTEEVIDMVQGKNVNPQIQQAFTNPETGEFDRTRLLEYLQNIDQMPTQQQLAWYLFENELRPGRLRVKLDNLLIKTNYITEAEAQSDYETQNTTAEVKYLYVPYFSVADSLVQVVDSQLSSYLSSHQDEFKTQQSRSLDFVKFAIEASSEDTAAILEEMEEIVDELESIEEDSVYARINSDGSNFFGTYDASNFPFQLQDRKEELQAGDIIGPEAVGTTFNIYKVSDIYEGDYQAKCRHILFKWTEDTPEAKREARQQANDVLRQIRNGADFAAMARQHGQDNTANRGGDLGWGTLGNKWVREFEEPVFAATSPGLINRIIETEFGYHIVDVTEAKDNIKYKIAIIERLITPSTATRNEAFRLAGLFQAKSGNLSEFTRNSEEEALNVFNAEKLDPSQRSIPSLGEARQIVQWLFNDASRGQVSDVFELDDNYVVAVMTNEVEEGVATLEEVRTEVTAKVKNELKGEKIIEQLTALNGSLDEIAEAYGEDAKVYSSTDLKLNTNFLPNVGLAPNAVGKVFAMQEGQTSVPFPSENGVIILQVDKITAASEIGDYSVFKDQLARNRDNQTSFQLAEAIKEAAEIKDIRYRFY